MLTNIQPQFAPVVSTLEGATARGVLWHAAPGRFLLQVPDVARYLVSDGAVITIDRAPAARDEEVMRFLNLTPLAALLFQRGNLAFHAASVSPPSPQQGKGPGMRVTYSVSKTASRSESGMSNVTLCGASGSSRIYSGMR